MSRCFGGDIEASVKQAVVLVVGFQHLFGGRIQVERFLL